MGNLNVSSIAKPRDGSVLAPAPELQTPTIPGQFSSMKIPVTLADTGLTVSFPRWPDLTAGHRIYLTVGGNDSLNRVTPPYIITALDVADLTKVFNLQLPNSYTAAEGDIIVSYMDTTRTISNPRWPVSPVVVKVDRTAPGGEVLPILLNPDETQIIRDLVENNFVNDQFETLVADYDGVEINDVVVPFIIPEGSATPIFFPGSAEVVDPDEVHTNRVRLFFEKSDIISQGDGLHSFGYQVTDEAGNVSVPSPLAKIQVLLLDVPATLLPPVVPDYLDAAGNGDGVVTYDDAITGVEVEIPPYVTPKEGDIITVNWGGQSGTPYPLKAADIGLDPVAVIILSIDLVKTAGSSATLPVFYTVTRGISTYPCPILSVNVDLTVPGGPDPERLLRPITVVGADGQVDVITEDDYGKDATATIPAYTNEVPANSAYLAGDEVSILWGGVPVLPPYTVITADVGRNLLLTVPASYITDKGAGIIPVTYSIKRELLPPYTPPQYAVGTATPTSVDVRSSDGLPNDGQPLTAPTFTIVNPDGVIDQESAVNGAPVRCPVIYPAVAVLDKVTLHFRGFDYDNPLQPIPVADFDLETEITSPNLSAGYVDIIVPLASLRKLCVGYGRATYTIMNSKGPTNSSETEVVVDQSDAVDPICSL